MFNVARFASMFPTPDDLDTMPDDLAVEDRWILSEFAKMMTIVEKAWSDIDIYRATQAIKTFATGILPSHWLEMAKSRLYADDVGAAWTIHRIVRDLMSAFSPICPFFSHHISSTLYNASAVDARSFPEILTIEGDLTELSDSLKEFNSMVWKAKKDKGLSLKSEVEGITIPSNLEDFTNILTAMHHLE